MMKQSILPFHFVDSTPYYLQTFKKQDLGDTIKYTIDLALDNKLKVPTPYKRARGGYFEPLSILESGVRTKSYALASDIAYHINAVAMYSKKTELVSISSVNLGYTVNNGYNLLVMPLGYILGVDYFVLTKNLVEQLVWGTQLMEREVDFFINVVQAREVIEPVKQ